MKSLGMNDDEFELKKASVGDIQARLTEYQAVLLDWSPGFYSISSRSSPFQEVPVVQCAPEKKLM